MTKPLTEKVTIERPVTGTVLELIRFARSVASNSTPEQIADDDYMIRRANNYWEHHHGDEHG